MNTRIATALSLILSACSLYGAEHQDDWPMYRADAAHSGYTSNPLSARLEIAWVRTTDNPPVPAWSGRDTRMPFDHAFQPVVSKGLVFWGSSSECKVFAADAKTGAEEWSFYTDSPVRFAPAIWNDRLFVVSDDGYLYCLTTQDGNLLWKKRGGPNAEMVLGNDRLVSRWPARGGVVIKDGILYFGAGLWPNEGVYLYAIDASTGEVLWVNDSSGGQVTEQPHRGNRTKSGVSIQGYLTIAGDSLIAPAGRATPAIFDRNTGAFKDFHLMKYSGGMGKRKGAGPFATAINTNYFIAEDASFQATSGSFVARGLPVNSTAVSPDLLVFSQGNKINAIKKSSFPSTTTNRNGKAMTSIGTIDWSISCSDPVGVSVRRATDNRYAKNFPELTKTANPPLIVAGTTIVAGTLNNKLITADITSTQVVTTAELDGLAMGLAVADNALYVCTDRGTLYCFVEGQNNESSTQNRPKDLKAPLDTKPYSDTKLYDQVAKQIAESADLSQGYCVDLGCGDGALSYAIAKACTLKVIAVDDDPKQIAIARKKLSAAGLYGTRVTVIQRDLTDTGLPSHFANVVVSGRTITEGIEALAREETQRLLRPYGGIALAGKPDSMQRIVGKQLAGAGDWTHQYADAANTLCGSDSLAKGPLKMQWFQDFGIQVPSRHGRAPAPLYKDGIMIVEGVHGLNGVDAYNGNRLWHYPLKDILKAYDQEHLVGTSSTGSNMCLADDSVFVRRDNYCLRINLKSGTLIQKYTMPDTSGRWGFIASEGGILYGTSSDKTHVIRQLYRNVSDMKELLSQSDNLFAQDIETGETKWVYRAKDSIRHNAIAIGDGNVYLIDKSKALADTGAKKKEPASTGTTSENHLICLSSNTGKVLWEQTLDIYGTTLALSTKHDILLMSYQFSQRTFQLPSEKGDRLTGFSTTDGKRLWDTPATYISRPVINDATIYTQPRSYNLLTGKQTPGFTVTGRQPGGCGPMSGSANLLLYRSGTLGYTDLLNNTGTENYGPVRPGCWVNAIVGGGLVLMPDATDRCVCSYQIKSSIGLVPQTQGR
ncbi:MAG: PQQ-binding-like beta-propeller repeat protein [Verrucomicrobia bacterium]|nr:PQQ-binding-like beta-propeller repeat protein [Verrucomicrobiota bacterium]